MFLLIQTIQRPAPVRRNRPLAEVEAERKRKKKPVTLGKTKIRIKGVILYPLIVIGLVSLLIGANRFMENMPLQDIHVVINSGADNQFLDVNMVKEIMHMDNTRTIVGEQMNAIQLKELEESLKANPLIEKAEVYKSISGNLNVEVDVRKPVARLINNSGDYIYLDQYGVKFPDTKLHSAYVPLVRGDFNEAIVDTFECTTIEAALPVLNFIHRDAYWNAQISDIMIRQDGELVFYPQVGRMAIEFGQPVRIGEKFDNLRDFYNQVVREVGLEKYRSISVKYKGQVVAKKR